MLKECKREDVLPEFAALSKGLEWMHQAEREGREREEKMGEGTQGGMATLAAPSLYIFSTLELFVLFM